jgi:hypothetical protein
MGSILRNGAESLCVASLCAAVAVGCSSGPSKSQITAAINDKLKEKVCVGFREKQAPTWPLRTNRGGGEMYRNLNPILTAMQSAGYIKITQEPVKFVYDANGWSKQEEEGLAPFTDVITPTEAAKSWWDVQDGYCVGTKAVAEIKQWTEPGKDSGMPITVQFTWHLVDVPSWANRAAFNKIEGLLTPVEATTVLQKTNNGWKVAI